MVKVEVAAKINLSLYITGKLDNGYHNLDSIISSISLFDTVEIEIASGSANSIALSNNSTERIIPYSAQKCVDSFVKTFGTPYVNIIASKRIPLGGGLGGSSAISAGIIIGMCKLFNIDNNCQQIQSFAMAMGADVPYQIIGGWAHMQGLGDCLDFFNTAATLHLVVAKGKESVNTADCFALYDANSKTENNNKLNNDLITKLQNRNLTNLQDYFSNHLLASAKQLCPEIETTFARLKQFKPLAISMSGSGSTVFALFETKEKCLQVVQTLKDDINYINYVSTINKGTML